MYGLIESSMKNLDEDQDKLSAVAGISITVSWTGWQFHMESTLNSHLAPVRHTLLDKSC